MRVWHPRAPALRKKTARVTVGRGPVPRRASVGREMPLVGVRFLRGSNARGENNVPITVGRGPVPRHASVGRKTALVGVRFSRESGARGENNVPITVGRGPVPRRASVGKEMAWVGGRFSRESGDRGGQAPALRARKGLSLHAPVRDQAIPNYSLLLLSC